MREVPVRARKASLLHAYITWEDDASDTRIEMYYGWFTDSYHVERFDAWVRSNTGKGATVEEAHAFLYRFASAECLEKVGANKLLGYT